MDVEWIVGLEVGNVNPMEAIASVDEAKLTQLPSRRLVNGIIELLPSELACEPR
ncbi:MAG: hypothetical protein ACR2KT_15180 [Methylocella sp.]